MVRLVSSNGSIVRLASLVGFMVASFFMMGAAALLMPSNDSFEGPQLLRASIDEDEIDPTNDDLPEPEDEEPGLTFDDWWVMYLEELIEDEYLTEEEAYWAWIDFLDMTDEEWE